MQQVQSHTGLVKIMNVVEKVGNKLPHPVILFLYLTAIIIICSFVLSIFDVAVVDPRPVGTKGRSADGLVYINSLLSFAGIEYMLTHLVSNFTSFAPLGTVVVAFMGVGVAEKSGLVVDFIKTLVKVTPKKLITAMTIIAGIISSIAVEVGHLILIPLGAIIFLNVGRHPLAGIAAAFAGVSGGYGANILITSLDPLLAGISQEAAGILHPGYQVGAESNWYFMIFSTFLITAVGVFITEKMIEPKLGAYDWGNISDETVNKMDMKDLTAERYAALRAVGYFSLGFIILLFLMIFPGHGFMLNQETMAMSGAPFWQAIITFLFLYFVGIGIIYGFKVGEFKNAIDVINSIKGAVESLSLYMVMAFFMSQFINYFNYTNIALVLAVSLADLIKSIGLNDIPLFCTFIFMIGLINMVMGSASAKWTLISPVFIPMFMLLGFSPELTQAAYRIGDSSTNIISPLNPYLPLIVTMGLRYVNNFGLGSLLSLMLPYSIVFMSVWGLVFCIWVFLLGLPVGPALNIYQPL